MRSTGAEWPVDRVIDLINPVLHGWVNYFRVGQSSRCFGYVKDWVEKKLRRHLMRARQRRGRVARRAPKALPVQ
jgi:RNA-directed DNA polymerase